MISGAWTQSASVQPTHHIFSETQKADKIKNSLVLKPPSEKPEKGFAIFWAGPGDEAIQRTH